MIYLLSFKLLAYWLLRFQSLTSVSDWGVTLFATVLQTQNPLGIKSLVIGVSSLAGN